MNHESMMAFAIAMAGLACVFIVFHLLRIMGQRLGLESKAAKNHYVPTIIAR